VVRLSVPPHGGLLSPGRVSGWQGGPYFRLMIVGGCWACSGTVGGELRRQVARPEVTSDPKVTFRRRSGRWSTMRTPANVRTTGTQVGEHRRCGLV